MNYNPSKFSFILLAILVVYVSSCCDCLEPCPDGGPIVTMVEEESLPWFDYYELAEDIIYTSELSRQRYDQQIDSTIVNKTIDTIQFAVVSNLDVEVSCAPNFDCPNICEQINAAASSLLNPSEISPSLLLSAGVLSEENMINVEVFSIEQKSYRFSIRNDGEIMNDIQVFKVERDNRNLKYSAVSQEEIDRVTVAELDEFNLDGVSYNQCFELIDSSSLGPNSFHYFKFIFNRNDGPIIFEDNQSSNETNQNERQFDQLILKKLR